MIWCIRETCPSPSSLESSAIDVIITRVPSGYIGLDLLKHSLCKPWPSEVRQEKPKKKKFTVKFRCSWNTDSESFLGNRKEEVELVTHPKMRD
jgi:hypothetical protein